MSKKIKGAAYFFLTLGVASAAFGDEILIADEKSQPESLTVTRAGDLIVGSASTPYVYRVRARSTAAEKFIDATAEGPGTFFFGMLADDSTSTLWTCQLTPVPNVNPPQRHTALRGFDLSNGKEKLRWSLPGGNSTCNDFAIGPDKALYITDTANAKVYKLESGASSAQLFLEHASLKGIDGITFLGRTLYVNNVGTSRIYRIPVDGSGKAEEPVEVSLEQPVGGPDGMRAANGKLFVAENKAGKISAITVSGDKGSVTVLKDGLLTPTGVEPAGDVLWVTERKTGKVLSLPLPK